MSHATSAPRFADPRRSGVQLALTAALVLTATAAALLSGYGFFGGNKILLVLPVAAMVAVLLMAVAVTRFAWFVLLLLGLRSSIDVIQLGQSGAAASAGTGSSRALEPSSLVGVLFLLLALMWLAARFSTGRQVALSRVSLWLVALLLACALSIVGSAYMGASALGTLRIMTAVVMFLVLEQLITTDTMMRRVIVACFVSLVIPLGFTLLGIASGHAASEVKGGFTRLIGTFAQSNDYARYLAFMVLFGVAIYPHVKGRLRLLLGIGVGLSSVFLVLTLTLAAIGATVIGLVLLALVQRRKSLFISVCIGCLLVLAVPGVSSRLVDSTTTSQVGGAATGNSVAWRFGYWAEILPLANSNPFTGIGENTTQYQTDSAKQPHSDFVRAYVETGVVGFVAYLGMLGSLFGAARRALRRSRFGTFDHGVSAGALACVLCFIIESLAANVINNVVNLWYLLAFTAVAAYVARTRTGLPGGDIDGDGDLDSGPTPDAAGGVAAQGAVRAHAAAADGAHALGSAPRTGAARPLDA